MDTQEKLMLALRELNILILATNKQLEAHRLLHDSAALVGDAKTCDKHREFMHSVLDISLDQTAEQQRVLGLIGKANS